MYLEYLYRQTGGMRTLCGSRLAISDKALGAEDDLMPCLSA
jgi:hypothetical protein